MKKACFLIRTLGGISSDAIEEVKTASSLDLPSGMGNVSSRNISRYND
jgi:hypothetical protein